MSVNKQEENDNEEKNVINDINFGSRCNVFFRLRKGLNSDSSGGDGNGIDCGN